MKVLFATGNISKLKRFSEKFKENGIDLISIKNLDFELTIDENGKTALENALLKAKPYYDKTGLITIGMDDTLYIEELPEELQPGTHVRRVNGKHLLDDELLNHYINLAKQYGGKLTAKWVYGLVVYVGDNKYYEYTWSRENFYFVDKPSEKSNPNYPLNSITIIPEYNKYLTDLTEEERKNSKNVNDNDVINFMLDILKGINENSK